MGGAVSGELPEGWAAVPLSELVEPGAPIQYGILQPGPDFAAGVPYVRPTEIVSDRIDAKALRRTSPDIARRYHRSSLRAGDVILSIVGTIGKVAVVPPELEGANITQSSARLRPRDGLVESDFLACLLRSPSARGLYDVAELGTGVPRLNIGDIRQMVLPVPPLSEQRRIVAKVEALFEQVNRAKGRLARVTRILKRFRQAVLAAACSGELTREWREEHAGWEEEAADFKSRLRVAVSRKQPVEPAEAEHNVPDGWPIVSLAAIATHLTSGSRAWSPYYQDDGFGTFVMAQNVRPMRFDQSHRQGVAPPPNDPERLRTTVHQHDILITIVGANTGDVCRVDVPVRDHFVCQSVALARLSVPGFAAFVELWLNSARHGQRLYQEWAYGEGRPHLSFDHLRSTPIAIPGQAEQSEILRRVSQLFALAEAIERRVQAATARAGKLPQAILSRAFSGELVPTEADLARAEGRRYETAADLIERVTAEPAKRRRQSGKGRGA